MLMILSVFMITFLMIVGFDLKVLGFYADGDGDDNG